MQVKTGGRPVVGALCALALGACDAHPEIQAPAADDAAVPAAAFEATGQGDVGPDEQPPSPEDEQPPAESVDSPEPRRRASIPPAVEAEPQEPPVEVEGVVITGPRDGETLGEYRARADQAFRRIDVDGDGRLDREEVTSGTGRLSFRTALEEGDIDLDETVSPQEFGDLTTRAFQRLDADGNGVITETEMEAGDPLASQ